MKTFDEIIPEIIKVLQVRSLELQNIDKLIINRDLNGRIRLLADENTTTNNKKIINGIAESMAYILGDRIPNKERVMYESYLDEVIKNAPYFSLTGFNNVIIADRLLGETNWGNILPINNKSHRIVFYSIKGGVGRSTALAATAWALAEEGKKVLVVDMDLESPGITSSLLPPEKSPMYGIVDWLVEDLINNGDIVFSNIFSLSDLSRNGEIFLVPSYGKNPGEYISKIGRAWMSNYISPENRELWQTRMDRLIQQLETNLKPDVVLIDSRAGIDEISAACITSLGAEAVLLFSLDTDQTWDGYTILFDHWLKTGAVKDIRERLQIVGALIPEKEANKYKENFNERSWDVFTNKLYDKIPADVSDSDLFSFDRDDEEGPHYPLCVYWNRGLEALPNMYQSLGQNINKDHVRLIFGDLIAFIKDIIGNGK